MREERPAKWTAHASIARGADACAAERLECTSVADADSVLMRECFSKEASESTWTRVRGIDLKNTVGGVDAKWNARVVQVRCDRVS